MTSVSHFCALFWSNLRSQLFGRNLFWSHAPFCRIKPENGLVRIAKHACVCSWSHFFSSICQWSICFDLTHPPPSDISISPCAKAGRGWRSHSKHINLKSAFNKRLNSHPFKVQILQIGLCSSQEMERDRRQAARTELLAQKSFFSVLKPQPAPGVEFKVT